MTFRLISKERDYYDSMFHAYGFDPKKIWNRDQKTMIINKNSNGNFNELFRDISDASDSKYYHGGRYIGVAGKLFEYAFNTNDIGSNLPVLYHRFNHDKVSIDHYKSCYFEFGVDKIKERMKNKSIISNDCIFSMAKAPIVEVLITSNDIEIKTNPNLKDVNFSSVMTAFEVFQSVEQYLESVLLEKEGIPQTSNNDRIISGAFDINKSFRHRS